MLTAVGTKRSVKLPAQDSVEDFLTDTSITGWDAILAVVVLLAAWLAARIARRAVIRVAGHLEGVSDDLRQLAGRIARYFVLLLGVGVALSILGAPIQPLLTAALLVGVVLVMALRGVADNFAAGVVIQTRRPIHLGDLIEGLDHVGTVQELNSRSVVIETADGRTVHLPNRQLLDDPIINHSTVGTRRSEVEVRASGPGPPDDVVEAIRAATAGTAGVLDSPACDVLLTAVEPQRVTARVRFWHAPLTSAAVSSAVIEAVTDSLRTQPIRVTAMTPPPPPPLSPPAPL